MTVPKRFARGHRRIPRWLVASLTGSLTIAVLVGVGALVVGHRIDQRVTAAVACRLPDGVEVAGIDSDSPALVALFTGDVGEVRLTVAADNDVVASMAADQTGAGVDPSPRIELSDGHVEASVSRSGIASTVVLQPSVQDGDILLTPSDVRIGNRSFAPELIADSLAAVAGSGLSDALEPRVVPGPDLLDGAWLASVAVVDDRLELELMVSADAASRVSADAAPCADARG